VTRYFLYLRSQLPPPVAVSHRFLESLFVFLLLPPLLVRLCPPALPDTHPRLQRSHRYWATPPSGRWSPATPEASILVTAAASQQTLTSTLGAATTVGANPPPARPRLCHHLVLHLQRPTSPHHQIRSSRKEAGPHIGTTAGYWKTREPVMHSSLTQGGRSTYRQPFSAPA
jgi:hypothetical protein